MAVLDFPASPSLGQTFTAQNGAVYTFNARGAWATPALPGVPSVTVAVVPPSNPRVGDLWFDSEDGNTYLFYDDGNSQAWVPSNVGTALAFDASGYLSAQDNLIINGGFDVAQRGASFSGSGANWTKTVDRWIFYPGLGSTGAVDQGNQPPGTVAGGDPVWRSVRLRRTVTGTESLQFFQNIENVKTANGQTVVISFDLYATVAGSISAYVVQSFGTGGSPSAAVVTNGTVSASTANIWERKTVTISVPSISGKTIGTNGDDCLGFYFAVPVALGNGDWNVANVDLRLGTLAPSKFLRRSIDQELAMCQRYYQKHLQVQAIGYGPAGQVVQADFSFPVTMRANPTVTFSAVAGSNCGAPYNNGVLTTHLRFAGNLTAAGPALGWTAADVALDAEL